MLVQVQVHSLGMDRLANQPVVILQECDGTRVLPIWIGPSEANAIATHLASVEVPRPLTHDLLVSVLAGLGGSLKRVSIVRVQDNTYFAELVVDRDGAIVTIDARPSDSIALALRAGATIFAAESLLDDQVVEVQDPDASEGAGAEEGAVDATMAPDELQAYLRRLDPEDFGRFRP